MNRPRHNFAAGRHAFTLLELMLALGLSGAVLVALYESSSIAFGTKASAEAAVEPGRTAGVALDFLREDLQSAVQPPASSTTTTTTDTTTTDASASTTLPVTLAGTFIGNDTRDDRGRDGDDLIFYTTAAGPQHDSGNGEIKMVELTVLASGDDHLLVRRVTGNLLNPNAVAQNPDDEVLCRGVSGFNLRYYDGTQWQDSWDSTQQNDELPAAVEVTLSLDRPGSPGETRTLKFLRIFSLPCSNLINDLNAQTSTSGTTTTTGTTGTGTTGAKTGAK